ncbi:MAG: isoleucine--tRNA ligase [Eubacteriaceae bacterium]|nr:isoleucine--tRNA ligase [Eubacteriaceae bacterium]
MAFKELSKERVSQIEKEIAKHWKSIDILNKTTEARKDCENWVFYEGPPTANGRPGIHHIIARALKDSVNKYKTMQGYRVVKKGGWDTHGLPVEIEVEKALKLDGKKDIEAYGIANFNEKCRESVFSYEATWREMTEKMGYFIDMDNPYITLDNNYIESVWWILDKYFKEGLIYEGYKILPYCPRCGTGLASHEVAQGYLEITSETVTVKFKLDGKDEYFLVWTTTPWTLASNTALAVNANLDYVRAKHEGVVYVLAAEKAGEVLGEGFEIIGTVKGKDLEGVRYEQLMPFLSTADMPGKTSFMVCCGDFVTVEDGTGIVHCAPAFGEDDFSLSQKYNLAFLNPVDERGAYTATPWKGMFAIDADKEIVEWLKTNGKLFKKQKMQHNYPHCWRCRTPLLYYARQSWYIAVTQYKDQLIKANQEVEWYPSFIGEGRFGNWLENLKDWAISRNRYWGTPLNIWKCECGHAQSVGSREELARLSIEDIPADIELHRPFVDDVHIKCPKCQNAMGRVKDVIDCWFDSGSMPFAQYHYPFGDTTEQNDQFPADFICEGIDQTRGWFYSLMAIGVFLSGHSPYKRVLVNDLILDKEGLKMSKSRGNTVDPFEMFETYGADALRWYLLAGSPVWQPTRFDDEGLKEVISKFFITFRNAYSFFALYANADGIDPRDFASEDVQQQDIDRWLLSRYNSMLKEVIQSMDVFDMTRTVRKIQEFVNEDLSNWFIRRCRRRFWADDLDDSKKSVYLTAFNVLEGVSRIAAPFAPYIAEEIYTRLTGNESVHLADYPQVEESLIDLELEEKMALARQLTSMGRSAREEAGIKVRQPIAQVIVDGAYCAKMQGIEELVLEELNAKEISFQNDLSEYMDYSLKPDYRVSGRIYGALIKPLATYLQNLEDPNSFLAELEKGGAEVELDGTAITVMQEHIEAKTSAKPGFNVQVDGGVFIAINTELSDELLAEGIARELVSKIQQLRKNKGLEITDRIRVQIQSSGFVLESVAKFENYISSEVLSVETGLGGDSVGEEMDINGYKAVVSISKA